MPALSLEALNRRGLAVTPHQWVAILSAERRMDELIRQHKQKLREA